MHLADAGYIRPRWGTAQLRVLVGSPTDPSLTSLIAVCFQEHNQIVAKWFYGTHPMQRFDTYYDRVAEVVPHKSVLPATNEKETKAETMATEEEETIYRTAMQTTYKLISCPTARRMKLCAYTEPVDIEDSAPHLG